MVRGMVFLVPIAASVAAGWAVGMPLAAAGDRLSWLGRLLAILLVSAAALWLADRLARRLLPMATLLELGLLFPREAPSRLAVARDAITRRPVATQLARLRAVRGDPNDAAREVLALLAQLTKHDRSTRGHAERVRMFTDLIAEEMGLPERDRDLLRWAAILHDIGKLEVPTRLLNKPSKPDAQEWALLRSHPERGAEIADGLLPWLGEWGEVLVQHHERWDGSGYPQGLAGQQICLGARIVGVADAFDVMTSARPYQRPVSRTAAFKELLRCSGHQFDAGVVRALLSVSIPRLRRAQGVVAWLAEIPFAAADTLSPAMLARIAGAGAVATTTLSTVQGHAPQPRHPETSASQRLGTVTPAAATHPAAPAAVTQPAGTTTRVTGAAVAAVASAAPAAPGSARGSALPVPVPTGSAPGVPDPTGTVPSVPVSTVPDPGVPSVPVPDPSPRVPVVGTVGGTVTGVVGVVGGVVNGVGGTVGGVVGAVGGTVGGTVGGVLNGVTGGTTGGGASGPVNTVTGTAGGVINTVTGLLGGPKPAPKKTADPSPDPAPKLPKLP